VRGRSPHSRDLRVGRISRRGQIYLITTRCHSSQKPFVDLSLGQIVADEIRFLDHAGVSGTFAYVVMPDHLHWLLQLSCDDSLSRVVGRLKGRAARRINLARQKTMRVWQSGFHDRALRRIEHLYEVGNYILENPVRAGLVKHREDYSLSYLAWSRT